MTDPAVSDLLDTLTEFDRRLMDGLFAVLERCFGMR